MTDEELINWLRNWYSPECHTAADRIKALSGDLKSVLAREAATQERHDLKMEALETKLATAAVGLKFYTEKEDYEPQYVTRDCGCCSDMEYPIILDDKGHLARFVLAKIEKETK
jgi:hypothetical protein